MRGILPIDIDETVDASYDDGKLMVNWFDAQTEEIAQKVIDYYKKYYNSPIRNFKLGKICVCVETYNAIDYIYVYEISDSLAAIVKFCKSAGFSCVIKKDNEILAET